METGGGFPAYASHVFIKGAFPTAEYDGYSSTLQTKERIGIFPEVIKKSEPYIVGWSFGVR